MTARVAVFWLLLVAAGCGGGGGGGGNPATALQILSTTLDDGAIGAGYGHSISVTGGTGARTFSITAGALPAGLALDAATGAVNGTPTGPAGTASLTITVRDSGTPQQTDAQAFNLRIAELLTVSTGTWPVATIGVPISNVLTASGGTPPYSYQIVAPAWLNIDGNGNVTGLPPPDAVTSPAVIAVFDRATPRQQAITSAELRVTLEVVTTALPDAFGGIEYHEFLRARGGRPPYDWSIQSPLPPGLSHTFFPGHILGVPVARCFPTTFPLDVEVRDRDLPPRTATRQGVTLLVTKTPLELPASALPVGRVGVPYDGFVQARFGVTPYHIAHTGGSLPSQLSFRDPTGHIIGTPDTIETQSFTVQATDFCGTKASNIFNLIVSRAPMGRNDSIATATEIANGAHLASISPSGHPSSVFAPDQDYYAIRTFAPSTVTIDLDGHGGEIDTVIQILDANGNRLSACGPPDFTSECVNDDETPGANLDSFLQVQIPGPTTFYVHVVEWRFDGRPDQRYTITVSGVN